MKKKTFIFYLVIVCSVILFLSTKRDKNDEVKIKFDNLLVFEKGEYFEATDFDTIITATVNNNNVQVSDLREVSYEGLITDIVSIELDSSQRLIYDSLSTKIEKNQWLWEQFGDKKFNSSQILYTHKDGTIESFPFVYHVID